MCACDCALVLVPAHVCVCACARVRVRACACAYVYLCVCMCAAPAQKAGVILEVCETGCNLAGGRQAARDTRGPYSHCAGALSACALLPRGPPGCTRPCYEQSPYVCALWYAELVRRAPGAAGCRGSRTRWGAAEVSAAAHRKALRSERAHLVGRERTLLRSLADSLGWAPQPKQDARARR